MQKVLGVIKGSYSDSLRLFNEAFKHYNQALNSSGSESKYLLKEALTLLLRASLLFQGISLPDLDITFLASIAMDKGLINSSDFAEINDLNLKLNGYGEFNLLEFKEVFVKIVKRLESLDPCLSQQINLFRY